MAPIPHEERRGPEVLTPRQHPPERWTSEFTTELLELLWVLETTVEGYPKQQELLESVLAGDCFRADELPGVPDEMRKPPKAQTSKNRVNERLPL